MQVNVTLDQIQHYSVEALDELVSRVTIILDELQVHIATYPQDEAYNQVLNTQMGQLMTMRKAFRILLAEKTEDTLIAA